MDWKEITRDYFTFTHKDRLAVLVLAVLIICLFLAPKFLSQKSGVIPYAQTDTSWISLVKAMEKKAMDENSYDEKTDPDRENNNSIQYGSSPGKNKQASQLFYFDPNTLDGAGWQKLGLRDKTIKTIQNYLAKGGHFYKPADLSRIYGLFDDEYARLEPYVRIEQKKNVVDGLKQTEKFNSHASRPERYQAIDINTSDTSAYIALPGIGSKLAARIVNFRDKLGGFYSIGQVGETFGLHDSVFQKIKQYLRLENGTLRKININTSTIDELKVHPYIRYGLANSIIAYRNEHGAFSKVEDIRKVMAITDEIYNKLSPYLTTDN